VVIGAFSNPLVLGSQPAVSISCYKIVVQSCEACSMHDSATQCSAHNSHKPSCVAGLASGSVVAPNVQETTGMASAMMTCSSAAGRRYSKHPAATDLHSSTHSEPLLHCPNRMTEAINVYFRNL
jgi:hypothetical protein